jgi:PAS domain S-box-containing protein
MRGESGARNHQEEGKRQSARYLKLQQMLESQHALLQTLIDNIPDLIFQKDREGRFVIANRSLANVVGLRDPKELIGKTDREVFPSEIAQNFMSDDRAVIETGQPRQNIEEPVVSASGSVTWVLTTKVPLLDEAGKVTGLLGIGRDITQRKELEEKNKQLATLVEQTDDAIVSFDLNRRITSWNKGAERLYGYTEEEIINSATPPTIPPELQDEARILWDRVIRDGQATQYETIRLRKDGSRIMVFHSLSAIRDAQGRIMGFASVARNITAHKQAEAALRRAETQFRTIFEQAPEAIGISRKGRIQFVNDPYRRMFLVRPDEELTSDSLVKHIAPECRHEIQKVNSSREDGGAAPLSYETVGLRSNGERFPLRVSAIEAKLPDGAAIIGFLTDLSAAQTAKEALSESQALLRAVMDSTPDMIWAVDAASLGLITFNRRFGEVVHGDLGIYLKAGDQPEDMLPTEESARLWRGFYQRAIQEGSFATTYTTAVTNRMLQISLNMFRRDDLVFGVSAFAKEVTEQRRAERQLAMSEERYRRLFENAPIGIAFLGTEREITHANQYCSDLLGLSEAAIIERGPAGIIHPDDWKPSMALSTKLRSGEIPEYHMEQRYIRGDGAVVWADTHVTAIRDQDGKLINTITWAQDITGRKQAERALRQSEERMRLFFERQLVGMAISDARKQWVEVNDRLCQMFNYSREELLQLRWDEITHPDDLEADVIQFDRMCAGGIDHYSMEKRYIRKDRTIVYARLLVACIRRPDRSMDYVLAIMEDVTEHNRAEEEKTKLQAQLLQAQKMESVGRLAGGVAHDFNNMLGVILGHTEVALEEVAPLQPLHDDLEEIHKAAERSASLTRQLLTFARKQTVTPKVLDLNQTVARMLRMLERMIGEDVQLTWKPSADLWPVKIDPSQVDQILTNLCINARDALANGGTMTIETENSGIDEVDDADHPGAVPGEYAVLVVQDNGCGMDTETQSHLFEPFFTTKDTGKGTGLGLATVYGIVKQNGGFIYVESAPGQGTKFSIYLPRSTEEVERAQEKVAVGSILHGQETILVVEDEAPNLKLIKRMLERQGYTVLEAGTPGDAIRVAREHAGEIHLLMTDVIMPGMNGDELAGILMSLYPKLKCLFMSGYTDDVIADHGVLEERVSFIQKPFSAKGLAGKVRQTIAQDGP